MKPEVTYPDPERLAVDYLTSRIEALPEDFTIAVGLPDDWTPADKPPHLAVYCDGTPLLRHPIVAHPTLRLVAYAATTTEAKRVLNVAVGLLAAHPGGGGVAGCRVLTGLLPARDPQTHAEMASGTVRFSVRSFPIEPVGS